MYRELRNLRVLDFYGLDPNEWTVIFEGPDFLVVGNGKEKIEVRY